MDCNACGGNINTDKTVPIKTGCASQSLGYACSDCGRVHWTDGEAAYNRSGEACFVVDGRREYVPEADEKTFANRRKKATAVS